ncbi:hypothetical protein NEPAR06_0377 [Nematocida parisii]|uniref:Uncharacterized protein n=1 Tax=Nematocida parisii (strain ERTm3) TaxID=935791 RepID=I3EG67_NEMP3|nr:uncharacterized protein NEPG_01291 [Nematocida parisii ERTm1]EIJ88214.1 hypothetical protein NEQG_01658 [Nematocida parisii ERTm3]KAI5125347.1 hypothetical protein NEPAR03_0022 [Nematocida parisii]EIJ93719.1 hypothetical protein NEPG_01291 [Nematocida parisii ERTm1]KAI5125471.1 hypothetical protein NEPAR08_0022 [Nematocida parisii]KAI5140647.1 hypothetical protein NEPAR04_0388 [Nematocida parisii]|eukprot:XP_013059119.1 hypothetical protein NEPG_01291 [Nematocida parisii ERTm1]
MEHHNKIKTETLEKKGHDYYNCICEAIKEKNSSFSSLADVVKLPDLSDMWESKNSADNLYDIFKEYKAQEQISIKNDLTEDQEKEICNAIDQKIKKSICENALNKLKSKIDENGSILLGINRYIGDYSNYSNDKALEYLYNNKSMIENEFSNLLVVCRNMYTTKEYFENLLNKEISNGRNSLPTYEMSKDKKKLCIIAVVVFVFAISLVTGAIFMLKFSSKKAV